MEVQNKCLKCKSYVEYLQVSGTILLIITKVVVGIFGNSTGLLASAIHSSASLINSISMYIFKKWGGKPANQNYPYGYGKIEYISAAMSSGALILLSLYLFFINLKSLIFNMSGITTGIGIIAPSYTIIPVIIICILIDEMGFYYHQCVGQHFENNTILSNAWVFRTDSISLVVVFLGVLATIFGYIGADKIVALMVLAFVIFTCSKLFIEAVTCLMDKSIPEYQIQKIRSALTGISTLGLAFKLTKVRARLNGQSIFVDVEIKMDKHDTVSHLNQAAEKIKEKVFEVNSEVSHVNVEYSV
ncbi:MAG: cation diffusion facilitator family transporter [Oligoflexia bacterium]|nr:cation diffusion facilitator family transporter [Oligoflexia bacterium]